MTSRIAICFALRFLRRRVRGASASVAELSLMGCSFVAIPGYPSNVGGPWWGVVIETVSEKVPETEDLFERVEQKAGSVSKEVLTDVRIRRYIRYVASHSLLPAEWRMRTLRHRGRGDPTSTISISAPAVRPVRSATRLRMTARGRRGWSLSCCASARGRAGFRRHQSGGSAIASGDAVATTDFATVTVLPGDTLWSIAESVAPASDPRKR